MGEKDIKNRIVRKMLRKRVIGQRKMSVDGVVNMALPSHAQGQGKQLIEEMVADPDAPLEAYGGGARENVRLKNADAAVQFLKENDGDVPFGFD